MTPRAKQIMRINIKLLKKGILIRCLGVQLRIRLVELNALLMKFLNVVFQIEHFTQSIQKCLKKIPYF